VLLNAEHDKAQLLTNECITCHAPFQVKETTIGALVGPLDQKGPWKLGLDASKWQAIKCESCHDVTSDKPFKLAFYDGTKGAYVQVADETALCENCHVAGTDDSHDLKGSVHEGLLCVSCHLRSEMNLDPRDSCRFCHPAVGPKGHPRRDEARHHLPQQGQQAQHPLRVEQDVPPAGHPRGEEVTGRTRYRRP
jgi:hypothetical protein